MKDVPIRINGLFNHLTVAASKIIPRALLRERTRILHSIAHRSRPNPEALPNVRIDGKSAALVTGASAGIGASFSELLASRGFDVVLVARREASLQRQAQALSNRYGVRTHVIVQDLANSAAAANIAAECENIGWPIELLVNNAGYPVTEAFHRMSWSEVNASLIILVKSVVELTHRFSQQMVERGSGKIINIASIAAFQPGTSRSSIYTASKAFVVGFSESVAADLAGTGVTVSVSAPDSRKPSGSLRSITEVKLFRSVS